MLRYPITQRFLSTSVPHSKQQKNLAQKILSSQTNRYDLGIGPSTTLFFKWLVSNPQKTLKSYQDKILASLTLDPSVQVSTRNVAGLSEIALENSNGKARTPTLMLHGHAASGLFYHRNFAQLSRHFQKLHAVDYPEVGLSDKRYLKIAPTKTDVKLKKLETGSVLYEIDQDLEKNFKSVRDVENYYIDAVEQWRQSHGFEKINLIGHSFGGHMSFKYAQRYPDRIKKLALVSPAGMERSIFSLHNSQKSGIVIQDPSSPSYYRNPFVPSFVAKFGFNILKALGPFGVSLTSKYLSARFTRGAVYDEEQVKLFLKYTVNLFYQRNNSFKALKVILSRQLLAASPILDNLSGFKVPTYFMYGQHDWMNVSAGYNAARELGNNLGKFGIVESAGHNIFLDNPNDFDREIINYFDD